MKNVKVKWDSKESYTPKEVEFLVTKASLMATLQVVSEVIDKLEVQKAKFQEAIDKLNKRKPDAAI